MDLIVGVNELWEDLSVVSQIVDQELERLSITIEEDFLINFLQFMQTIEHLLQCRARDEPQDIPLGHHVVRSSHIEGHNLAVEFDHGSDLGLVLLPLISFLLNLSLSLIQFLLHVQVESLQEFVVGDQLIPDLVVLECPIVEQVVDLGDVVGEDLLDLLDA